MQRQVRHWDHGLSPKKKREVEARNLSEVMSLIGFLDQRRREGSDQSFFTRSIVEHVHSLTVAGIYPCGGEIRDHYTEQVDVKRATFTPADPSDVPMRLEALLEQCRSLESSPPESEAIAIFASCYMFHEFLVIHPFNGGNGRVARALLDLLLLSLNLIVPAGTIHRYIADTHDHYLNHLKYADDMSRPLEERLAPLTDYVLVGVYNQRLVNVCNLALETRPAEKYHPELGPVFREIELLKKRVAPTHVYEDLMAQSNEFLRLMSQLERVILS